MKISMVHPVYKENLMKGKLEVNNPNMVPIHLFDKKALKNYPSMKRVNVLEVEVHPG